MDINSARLHRAEASVKRNNNIGLRDGVLESPHSECIRNSNLEGIKSESSYINLE